MIIVINGAFGVGKTTIANQLLEGIPDSIIYDPEEVGYMLRNIIPSTIRYSEEQTDDFQDLELWRILTVRIATELQIKYKKTLIIPMTIWNINHFNYIMNGFRLIESNVYHFCLTASKKTIYQRLLGRGEEKGSWAFIQTDKCLESYDRFDFGEYIDTENREIKDIVEYIVRKVM